MTTAGVDSALAPAFTLLGARQHRH